MYYLSLLYIMTTQQRENQTMDSSFFFSRTSSKKTKSNSSVLPPYSKRAFVAIIVVIPVAFGLNVPLNSFASFIPVWGVIMINSIVIAAYMTFIMPRVSKLLASWLNSTTVKEIIQNAKDGSNAPSYSFSKGTM